MITQILVSSGKVAVALAVGVVGGVADGPQISRSAEAISVCADVRSNGLEWPRVAGSSAVDVDSASATGGPVGGEYVVGAPRAIHAGQVTVTRGSRNP